MSGETVAEALLAWLAGHVGAWSVSMLAMEIKRNRHDVQEALRILVSKGQIRRYSYGMYGLPRS